MVTPAKHQPKWLLAEPDKRLGILLDQVNEMCTIPESAQRVLELTRSHDADIVPVVDAIMKDPVLAAELLRLANSPFFGQTREVVDIRRAVIILGMQELHDIAAAMSMLGAFSTASELSSRLRAQSVLSATLARYLAHEIRSPNESAAFLTGLLCELGAMACVAVDPDGYEAIWQSAGDDVGARATLEVERYTARSETIGAELLLRKNLPEIVATAVGTTDDTTQDVLSRVALFARRAAQLLVIASETADAVSLGAAIPALGEQLGFSNIEGSALTNMCISAATTAELSLRGEVTLVEEEEEDEAAGEQASTRSTDLSIEITDTHPASAASGEGKGQNKTAVRLAAQSEERSISPLAIAGIAIAGIAIATAIYFFFS